MPSPSIAHELPLFLFRKCPTLVLHLLHRFDVELSRSVPSYAAIDMDDSNLSRLLRKISAEFRTDLVLLLRDGAGTPVFGLVIEVQTTIDTRKAYTLPVYG